MLRCVAALSRQELFISEDKMKQEINNGCRQCNSNLHYLQSWVLRDTRVRSSEIRRELREESLLLDVKKRPVEFFGHLIRTPSFGGFPDC